MTSTGNASSRAAASQRESGIMQIAETLRQAILGLYDKHLAPDGKSVNYKALGADPAFKAFAAATAELQVCACASQT